MTKSHFKDLLKSYLSKYPNLKSSSKLADLVVKENPLLDYTHSWVRKCLSKLSKEPNFSEKTEQDSQGFDCKYSSDQKKTDWTIEGSSVRTLKDLIKYFEVDLEIWEVDRVIANKWEVGAKVGPKDNLHIETTPLFQIKAYLKKKSQPILDLKKLREELITELPKYQLWVSTNHSSYTKKPDSSLLSINIFDLHYGKLGWHEETGENYNHDIAEQRFFSAIEDLINKTSSFDIDKILFPVGNDFFNSDIDVPYSMTTGGTPQTNDSRYQQLFREGRKMLVSAINRLSTIAPVEVKTISGNHDTQRIFYLGDVLEVAFENNKNVSVDNSPRFRKYFQYERNLIGLTHGDKEKPADLPLIMANEVPKLWAETHYREWHLGHEHHKKIISHKSEEDFKGVNVKYMRSLSGPDSWHYGKGFVGSIKGAEAFVYDKEEGLVSSVYHNIK
jgi:hypothetical protein